MDEWNRETQDHCVVNNIEVGILNFIFFWGEGIVRLLQFFDQSYREWAWEWFFDVSMHKYSHFQTAIAQNGFFRFNLLWKLIENSRGVTYTSNWSIFIGIRCLKFVPLFMLMIFQSMCSGFSYILTTFLISFSDIWYNFCFDRLMYWKKFFSSILYG